MRYTKIILSLLMVTLSYGCASLSKEECLTGNWNGIGYKDGANGESASRLSEHQKACSEHKVNIDSNAYRAGRDRGLEQVYCKPRNAYQLGLSGKGYGNVCPSRLNVKFLAAYRYGKDINRHQYKANKLHDHLKHLNLDIHNLDQRIARLDVVIRDYHKHKGALRRKLRNHIHNELDKLDARIDNDISHYSRHYHLNRPQKHALHDMSLLATEKGRYENRLHWHKEYAHHRARHGRIHHLHKKIANLNNQIRHKFQFISKGKRRDDRHNKFTRLNQLSEYAGELGSQLKILQRAENNHEVKDVGHFHYQHELPFIKRHSDKLLAHFEQRKSIRALRKERQHLKHDYGRLLDKIYEIDNKLKRVEREIEDLKRNSPY